MCFSRKTSELPSPFTFYYFFASFRSPLFLPLNFSLCLFFPALLFLPFSLTSFILQKKLFWLIRERCLQRDVKPSTKQSKVRKNSGKTILLMKSYMWCSLSYYCCYMAEKISLAREKNLSASAREKENFERQAHERENPHSNFLTHFFLLSTKVQALPIFPRFYQPFGFSQLSQRFLSLTAAKLVHVRSHALLFSTIFTTRRIFHIFMLILFF